MHVVATAGHVDHGKSTLVRALTGMEPDRFAEERRRGLTIDLGYAWCALPSGEQVAFVDVPGHERFIGNMLAGIGPAPAVLFVVAADGGWGRQSEEHLAAVDALRVRHGLLAITRADLADPGPAMADARARLARSSLGSVPAVAVSAVTGAGLDAVRAGLDELVAGLPAPDRNAPMRLWLDRCFTVRGSGTVVTATLAAGSVAVGDTLCTAAGREVTVRGVQSAGHAADRVGAVARVALNLRGVERGELGRGDALLTPETWLATASCDVRLSYEDEPPSRLVLHVGTAAVPARVRPLAPGLARLGLDHPLPLRAGDRGVLRDPGRHAIAAGVLVLDADPPPLDRRGAAAQRARELAGYDGRPDLHAEVARRGAVRAEHLARLGIPLVAADGLPGAAGWLVAPARWAGWLAAVPDHVTGWAREHPLEPAVPLPVVRRLLDLPDDALAAALVRRAGLETVAGGVRAPGHGARTLGPAERGLAVLADRLAADPFRAPEQAELAGLGLGRRELGAAERDGRLLRLPGDVVLLPDAPARAVAVLRELPQPFTTAEARAALRTTRRVAVPLLEHLDGLGATDRLDASHRRVREC